MKYTKHSEKVSKSKSFDIRQKYHFEMLRLVEEKIIIELSAMLLYRDHIYSNTEFAFYLKLLK